jgi:hypothetical protein
VKLAEAMLFLELVEPGVIGYGVVIGLIICRRLPMVVWVSL